MPPTTCSTSCGCHHFGFLSEGIRLSLLAARGFDGDWIRVGNWGAMKMAGHSNIDMTMVYQLEDKAEQERGVRAFQKRILGKPEGPVQCGGVVGLRELESLTSSVSRKRSNQLSYRPAGHRKSIPNIASSRSSSARFGASAAPLKFS